MKVAIVDYGSGNLHSASKAFERAARESGLDAQVALTSDPGAVLAADRLVLPGVGTFNDCRRGLEAVPGLAEALTEAVQVRGRPFLGICVGMQLLAATGLEHGPSPGVGWPGLGWIGGEVAPLAPADPSLKIPHMGWNTLDASRPHPLLAGIPTGPEGWHAYFVHSYAFRPVDGADAVATTDYGGAVTAIVGRGNVAGTQFHPEKSQALGLALISNFLRWAP